MEVDTFVRPLRLRVRSSFKNEDIQSKLRRNYKFRSQVCHVEARLKLVEMTRWMIYSAELGGDMVSLPAFHLQLRHFTLSLVVTQ
jgi:hypothetical protein